MTDPEKCARRYDRQFKEDAVALVLNGKTIVEVAHDLGISNWSLRKWVRKTRKGQALDEPQTLAQETPEQREMRRLKQENDYLKRQRDILKKALAIVSDSNLSSDSR